MTPDLENVGGRMNEIETMLLRDRLHVAIERRNGSTPNSRTWQRAGAEMQVVRARLTTIQGLRVADVRAQEAVTVV
jgi:hypothetical protein